MFNVNAQLFHITFPPSSNFLGIVSLRIWGMDCLREEYYFKQCQNRLNKNALFISFSIQIKL